VPSTKEGRRREGGWLGSCPCEGPAACGGAPPPCRDTAAIHAESSTKSGGVCVSAKGGGAVHEGGPRKGVGGWGAVPAHLKENIDVFRFAIGRLNPIAEAVCSWSDSTAWVAEGLAGRDGPGSRHGCVRTCVQACVRLPGAACGLACGPARAACGPACGFARPILRPPPLSAPFGSALSRMENSEERNET
jgi:hypothetical protein